MADVADPRVGGGHVLVRVRAAGVNPVDWKVMAGYLDPMIGAVFPIIPGWDVAGEVVARGLDTPEFAVDDEVMVNRGPKRHGDVVGRVVGKAGVNNRGPGRRRRLLWRPREFVR